MRTDLKIQQLLLASSSIYLPTHSKWVTQESSKHGRKRGITTKQRISNFMRFVNKAQSTRRDDRAAPSQPETPQRNATCAGNRGRGPLPDRRSAGAPKFRSVVPSPAKLGCCGLGGMVDQEPPVIKTGILWEEDPSCGVVFEPQFCCILKLILARGKAKIEAFAEFCCPNFCCFFEDYNFCMVKLYFEFP